MLAGGLYSFLDGFPADRAILFPLLTCYTKFKIFNKGSIFLGKFLLSSYTQPGDDKNEIHFLKSKVPQIPGKYDIDFVDKKSDINKETIYF